ncbi:hypothetical protein [Kordiimonas sp. SCSIO 12610]|uniref:hypothetical protein n=1 Tax=Kordiimonas sp. SCSIO 12610 TaxID=2829597 RepID=UPI0021095CA5|nr:hypothetical protein [Kordiimonas sp. SCSIO 12610]UTW54923.1 hypothetical protein KFF44_14115 [Kordiimonas sp. SCSIO 12610]
MSFYEKSNVAMLITIIGVYGWYFFLVLGIADNVPVDEHPIAVAVISVHLAITVGLMVLVGIIAHVAIALYGLKKEGEVGDMADERDKTIEMRGDQKGGFILGIGVVLTVGLMLIEQSNFVVVNVLLGVLVLAEIVKGISKLIDYRRGI